jgi:hypothetical protein
MPQTAGGVLNRIAGPRPARRAFKQTRSQYGRSLSPLQSWEHENARNSAASSGFDCAVRCHFPESSSNGHVLTTTSRRCAFRSWLREVESAAGPQLTAGASACLRQRDPINDCTKCAESFRPHSRNALTRVSEKPRLSWQSSGQPY